MVAGEGEGESAPLYMFVVRKVLHERSFEETLSGVFNWAAFKPPHNG